MQSFVAFTRSEEKRINVLRTAINITVDTKINPNFSLSQNKFGAIWDTGATNTVICDRLAKKLKLTSIGMAKVSTAGGIVEVNRYVINIQLPNQLLIQNVIVTEGNLDEDTDFLIGMDIIGLGDFSITNVDGKTTFSFRYPSCETIDYVREGRILHKKDLQKRLRQLEKQIKTEGKCPCGSGKRYRYCHGKEEIKNIQQELGKFDF